ncbi:pyridoxal phosphate-dependent transferase [Chiua virens]|nr:pyridoxal phosphate-dependent transferase [Chiua virens]
MSSAPSEHRTGPSTRYLKVTHDLSSAPKAAITSSTLSLGEQYILGVYARPPFVLSHGRGSWVWDTENRKFLDFKVSTWSYPIYFYAFSKSHAQQVLREQASTLLHASNVYHNQWAPKLAELIVTLTQQHGGLGFPAGSSPSTTSAKVFFANTGTEANEGALKIARKVGKDRWAAATGCEPDDPACPKTRIVCFENSFHGRSMGALSVTSTEKYQAPFRPLIPDVDVGKLNDHEGLSKLITDDTCVVIVEPVQGEGGVTAADEVWLRALRNGAMRLGLC